MEQRVKSLESGMKDLRDEVSKLKESLNTALLGSLDGKPGIMATLQNLVDARRTDTAKLDTLTATLDSLRLDRAKVVGIVLACGAFWALITKFVLK